MQAPVISGSVSSTSEKKRHRLAVLAFLLLAFALRLYQLGAESLWYDETVSVVLARKSMPDLLAHTAGDIHPPGYYLLLHAWQGWAQPSLVHGLEFLFAWPSLYFGLLIVALLYPIARATYGSPTALLTVGLAAIHPFQVWYSQEVRMYTLGAALGLLSLWAVLKTVQNDGRTRIGWLLVYVLAAASGLYTLYYFLFLLIPLNLTWLWLLWRTKGQSPTSGKATLLPWFLAQMGVLTLWSPWLPIFWRQATDPPVPPWRTSWLNSAELARDLAETFGALLVGQSPPGQIHWPWAVVTVAVIGLAIMYVKARPENVTNGWLLLSATCGPILLLYLITGAVTPVYHVRYLFTYAAPFLILLAATLLALYQRRRTLGVLALVGMLLANGWSLRDFWFAAPYRADDHRGAVAYLAEQWRPGDLILVNAGWAYTTLLTYWPTELATAASALPPAISQSQRIIDYANESFDQPSSLIDLTQSPVVVRTGSMDGSPRLGWGDPRSDFFAMPSANTAALLDKAAANHTRLWHYRLYDTVNDPQGVIRSWLEANNTLLIDQPIAGRDYLRIQLFQPKTSHVAEWVANTARPDATFGKALLLTAEQHPAQAVAGSTLYLQTAWQALPNLSTFPVGLAFSVRLYDEAGQLVAQQDAPALPPTSAWLPDQSYPLTLAVPIPAASKPARYQLGLVVYSADTAQPLTHDSAPADQPLFPLGTVNITVSQLATPAQHALATFDYLDLLTAETALVDQHLQITLIWQPRPNNYTDTYLALIELRDPVGGVVQQWQEALGGWHYPSAGWPSAIPVQDQYRWPVDFALPSGDYALWLRLVRNSDQSEINARQGWWPSSQAAIPLATITIGEPVSQ